MKRENIIDLAPYYNRCSEAETMTEATTISDELQKAIQNLIYRLRELGPMQS
ncbi:MAG: hypothetical protein KF702_04555 [Gammaproteobacteria bacterium]|nr:hypothetical protein [Gammaproteobacteria bacterium]